jgi:hypothetical protein
MNKENTPGRTVSKKNRANLPHANRQYPRAQPPRRIQPFLMKHWKYLWREEFIEVRRGNAVTAMGWVDDFTPDGTIIWICLADGMGRTMIHRNDGLEIWRVDSRILQDRRRPGQKPANVGEEKSQHHHDS